MWGCCSTTASQPKWQHICTADVLTAHEVVRVVPGMLPTKQMTVDPALNRDAQLKRKVSEMYLCRMRELTMRQTSKARAQAYRCPCGTAMVAQSLPHYQARADLAISPNQLSIST